MDSVEQASRHRSEVTASLGFSFRRYRMSTPAHARPARLFQVILLDVTLTTTADEGVFINPGNGFPFIDNNRCRRMYVEFYGLIGEPFRTTPEPMPSSLVQVMGKA